jgi:hypothetical protein
MKPEQYYEEFLNFVFTYSPKTKIRNKSPVTKCASWFYCALGTFVKKNNLADVSKYYEVTNKASNINTTFPMDLRWKLNNSAFKTYGTLQKFLLENYRADVFKFVPEHRLKELNYF